MSELAYPLVAAQEDPTLIPRARGSKLIPRSRPGRRTPRQDGDTALLRRSLTVDETAFVRSIFDFSRKGVPGGAI